MVPFYGFFSNKKSTAIVIVYIYSHIFFSVKQFQVTMVVNPSWGPNALGSSTAVLELWLGLKAVPQFRILPSGEGNY